MSFTEKNSEDHPSSMGDEDFNVSFADDTGEDFEGTLDEEEALDPQDYADELKDLEDEGELSIEELRRRYGLPPEGEALEQEEDGDEEGEGEEDTDDVEEANPGYFDGSLDEEETEEEDKDYAPVDPWKKEVRVDESRYQATIPAQDFSSGVEYDMHLEPLWMPSDAVSREELDGYLRQVFAERMKQNPESEQTRELPTRDDEEGLYLLLKQNFNFMLALQSFPIPPINQPRLTTRGTDVPVWTDEEKTCFELAMNTHGKNFSVIRRERFPHRPIGELIQYYYSWKKTDRYHNYRKRQLQHEPEEFTNTLMHQHHLANDALLEGVQQHSSQELKVGPVEEVVLDAVGQV